MTQPAETPEVIPNLFIEEPGDTPETPPPATEADPADPTAPTEPAPETPAEPVPDPAAARVSARIEAARKQELKAARERGAMARERAELDAYRERVGKLKSGDPLAVLDEVGLSKDEFLKRVVSEGKPTTESEIADLRAQLKEEREARLQATQKQAEVQHTQYVEQCKDQFMTLVESRHADFAHLLTEYTPKEIRQYGYAIAMQDGAAYREEHGEDMPDEAIAVRLNEFAKSRAQEREAWRTKVIGAPKTGEVSSSESDQAGSGPQVSRPNAPRTLTNGKASQKASVAKFSQEDADAESIRILEQAMRANA